MMAHWSQPLLDRRAIPPHRLGDHDGSHSRRTALRPTNLAQVRFTAEVGADTGLPVASHRAIQSVMASHRAGSSVSPTLSPQSQ